MSLAAFQVLRRHHAAGPHAAEPLVLWTTPPYAPLVTQFGLFDTVWSHPRAKSLASMRALRPLLKPYRRIYDLQAVDRTQLYFWLLWPRPPAWCGHARGARFRLKAAAVLRKKLHPLCFDSQILAAAGIQYEPFLPDFSWVREPETPEPGPESESGAAVRHLMASGRKWVLMVIGSSERRAVKRWPGAHFLTIARRLWARGLQPVLIGGASETQLAQTMKEACPNLTNLVGKLTYNDLFFVARRARAALGNDTGPTHACWLQACPTLLLLDTHESPEGLARPPACARYETLRVPALSQGETLPPETVWEKMEKLLAA